jgi:DNA helicase IV
MDKKDANTGLSHLTNKQLEAIQAEDKRVLVLAGAGSGKTHTLLEKILYLINEKGAKPSEILAITFTKNAANEMIDRLIYSARKDEHFKIQMSDKTITEAQKNSIRREAINQIPWVKNLTVRTFHSLCYTILKTYGADTFDNQFRLIGDAGITEPEMSKLTANESDYEVLQKVLIECCGDREYMLRFKRYVLDYLVDRIQLPERESVQLLSEGKFYTSLNATKVRSKSELYIADWLYRHNIPFVYEPNVQFMEIAFHPDFYIPGANIYLEHVSKLSKGMELKEQQFLYAGKTLIRTFEAMTRDTSIFNLALDRILRDHIPKDSAIENALNYEEEFRGRHHEIRNFLRQVIRVMDMIKVDNQDLETICNKGIADAHQRVRDFYHLVKPLIERYQQYCIDRSYLDFNDLNIRAIELLESQTEIRDKFFKKFRFVLVDEFQDVNKIQVKFIKTLMNPMAQLFCVGDDWQSIYGFRGSDVQFIVQFHKFFKNAKILQLDKNFRSNSSIVDASTEVIRNNKFKIDKDIQATRQSPAKIEVYAAIDGFDALEYVVQELKDLKKQGIEGDKVLFLYRRSKMFMPYRTRFKKENLRVKANTIHAAKGLESKVVFIIGLTEGAGGFPDIWLDDRIYQIIRPVKYDTLMEEERRLFYVALTRAEDRLYLITELGNESQFIAEIPENYKVLYTRTLQAHVPKRHKCPECSKDLEQSYQFCPFCGTAIPTQNDEVQ